MKNLLGAVVFLAIAALVGAKLYERAQDMDWVESDPSEAELAEGAVKRLRYPDDLELRNRDGRALEVTLIGRSQTHVQFRRAGDAQAFVYAIDQLDTASERLVRQYPETQIHNADKHLERGELDLAALQVENLRREIARIDEKCATIKKKHAASQSQTERRTLVNEFEELQRERVALEEDLSKYENQ